MELRQLSYFAKAAETLNFSEAARMLCITQSTLSQQIKQLEESLNVQLFQRNSHSVALTEAGEELLPYALNALQAAETCIDRINDLKDSLTGNLNIGVTYSFSPILTETLFAFTEKYPHVKLNIYYKSMAELMDMLQHRQVDFVLAFKPIEHFEGIESHILFENYLAAVVNDRHPLARKEKVSLAELERFDIALPAPGMQARSVLNKITERFRCKLRIRIELNEVNILLKLVRQSNLVTILSEAIIHNETGVKAIPLDAPDNEMKGCVHVLKNVYRKHSSIEFIRLLSESNAIRERIRHWV